MEMFWFGMRITVVKDPTGGTPGQSWTTMFTDVATATDYDRMVVDNARSHQVQATFEHFRWFNNEWHRASKSTTGPLPG